jgi:hypothetical protein
MKTRIITRTEANMLRRTETDRIMWFSMWFLGSIATFGLAFFPMFHYLIERRNKHFARQHDLEELIVTYLKSKGKEPQLATETLPTRNAKLWTASILLVFPAFFIAYFLSKDLFLHEKHQQTLFWSLFPDGKFHLFGINVKLCAGITIATLGFGIVYWLYKIFNIYNNHFEEQWKVEEMIARLMEGKSYGEISGQA